MGDQHRGDLVAQRRQRRRHVGKQALLLAREVQEQVLAQLAELRRQRRLRPRLATAHQRPELAHQLVQIVVIVLELEDGIDGFHPRSIRRPAAAPAATTAMESPGGC